MLCIGTGSAVNDANRMRFENDEFYMKTEEEMRRSPSSPGVRQHGWWPTRSTLCSGATPFCPFPLARGAKPKSLVPQAVRWGLKKLRRPRCPRAWDRYEYEAGIILQQGFPAYFLIVQEYIAWARSQGIGVGRGRGSAAGAICTYAMGITDLDPLPNGLLFERFLSPERVEMPISTLTSNERRQGVIEHIKEVYGEDHVSGVITFGKLQAKNAVRDAARVLDYPYSVGDRICKMIGDELGITIDKALETNPDLKKAYDDGGVRQVVDAAKSIEGHVRGEACMPAQPSSAATLWPTTCP